MLISKIHKVLAIAARVPGNRQRFLDAGLLETKTGQLVEHWREKFPNLQPIDKAEIRNSPGLFLANASDVVYRGTTSGSRGQVLTYFAGEEWNRLRVAARMRSLRWWGIDDSIPIVNVASRLQPIRSVDVTLAGEIDEGFLTRLLEVLSVRPAVVRGYPSRLCEVASRLYGKSLPTVLGVIVTGEGWFEFQKSLLERVFDAPFIDEYGCQETGISGLTCPEANRLHLDSDRCLYEVIDGQLVTTDLYNFTMPMVRYCCGDVVELEETPCSCGRKGLTATVCGRVEDTIETSRGRVFSGNVKLPPFPGILNYQVIRRETSIDLILKEVVEKWSDRNLEPLDNWIRHTFGNLEIRYFGKPPSPPEVPPREVLSEKDWISQLTSGSWGDLFDRSLPQGNIAAAAKLLKQAIDPSIISGSGISEATRNLAIAVSQTPTTGNPDIDRTIGRILLFANTVLGGDELLCDRAVEILREAEGDRFSDPTQFDLYLLSLYQKTEKLQSILDYRPCQIDRFNIHHSLYGFEGAIATARNRNSPLTKSLNPLLAIFIADLNFFASRFHTAILASWRELIWNREIWEISRITDADSFLTAWLHLRRAFWKNRKTPEILEAALTKLRETAKTPQEQAKAILETGYVNLLLEKQLDSEFWLTTAMQQSQNLDRTLEKGEFDPLPWSPILRNIAQGFLNGGKPELAYQCLLASAPPSSRVSAFERLAKHCNRKQSPIFEIRDR
ncbi:hypothetical protein [Baaleninema simplex]|uniref:hypothetical protein n=1 Tax=Baaleninema simplex TaxID=2862350 RepID=UPI001181979C|nr:hypothetical protein [Baaleninema simplex]